MDFDEPGCESVAHVDFGGWYLTHAIWRNSYGSRQPETGARSHAAGLKDFRLIQHDCDDWPLVTVVALAGLSKGWHEYRIAEAIAWLHRRRRAWAMRNRFREMHDDLVAALH